MAAAKAEVKKEEDLSLPEYFMRGAKKGFYITVELIAPAIDRKSTRLNSSHPK